jgi:hypothetical protein
MADGQRPLDRRDHEAALDLVNCLDALAARVGLDAAATPKAWAKHALFKALAVAIKQRTWR